MNIQKTRIGLVAAMLVVGTTGLQALPASGTFTNSFSGSAALWDVSGSYTSNIPTELADFTAKYALTMDPNGKFTSRPGSTVTAPSLDDYAVSLNADLTVVGAVKTVSGSPHGTLTLKMQELNGESPYGEFTFKATAKGNLALNIQTAELTGSVKGSGSVSVPSQHVHKSKSFRDSPFAISLPPGKSGTWELTIDVTATETKYNGTGWIMLSSGRIIQITRVTGTYAATGASKGTSKLTLKGTGVNLTLTGVLQPNGTITDPKLSGKALGQTLK